MNDRAALLVIALAALAALGLLAAIAPQYLTAAGFPLDDAWIHAVYGRELARSGMLAYNPGVPATGSTSPLWSAAFALAHLSTAQVATMVAFVKLLGFALHVATALLVYRALAVSGRRGPSILGGVLIAAHPDLISASLSGMEVPLATCLAAALWCAAARASVLAYGIVSVLGALARPELAVLTVGLPILSPGRLHARARMTVAGGLGSAAAFATLAARNLAVSGLPLPATFYAKVGGGAGPFEAVLLGFRGLLGEFPLVDSSILLTVLLGISMAAHAARWRAPALAGSVGAFAAGLAYCAVSFVLVPPIDPQAFYHQRYVLPALPLLIGPMPLLLDAWASGWLPGNLRFAARATILALFGASLLVSMPERFDRLANDAHNIDDVQVSVGRTLASARDGDVVWAVDAGAVRYFGNAFVVDMVGLNTPQVIGGGAATFLAAHPPRFFEIVPGWSRVDGIESLQLPIAHFAPSTPYTVTGYTPMREHWLVACDGAATTLRYTIGARTFPLECRGAVAGGIRRRSGPRAATRAAATKRG